ncbi:MAG: thioredoxin family protein [Bacteroidota bacterium]
MLRLTLLCSLFAAFIGCEPASDASSAPGTPAEIVSVPDSVLFAEGEMASFDPDGAFARAVDRARDLDRDILLYFCSPESLPCGLVEESYIREPAYQAALSEQYVGVEYNDEVVRQAIFYQAYGFQDGVPRFVVLDTTLALKGIHTGLPARLNGDEKPIVSGDALTEQVLALAGNDSALVMPDSLSLDMLR